MLYQKNLKNREFDKEAAQVFGLERATIVRALGASEGRKFAAKLTQSKTDSSSSFGVFRLLLFFAFLIQVPFLTAVEFFSEEDACEQEVKLPESYVLPLSYDDDAPLLVVPIPQSFQMKFNGSSYPDVVFLEFTPQRENKGRSTELITICQSTDTTDAHQFIKDFKSVMEESQLLDSFPNYTSYIRCGLERGIKVGYYISEHPAIDPHQMGIQAPQYNEMLKVKAVQGEDRVWVIQYAIQYNSRSITEEQRQKMMEQIIDFFKSCKVSSNVTGSML